MESPQRDEDECVKLVPYRLIPEFQPVAVNCNHGVTLGAFSTGSPPPPPRHRLRDGVGLLTRRLSKRLPSRSDGHGQACTSDVAAPLKWPSRHSGNSHTGDEGRCPREAVIASPKMCAIQPWTLCVPTLGSIQVWGALMSASKWMLGSIYFLNRWEAQMCNPQCRT